MLEQHLATKHASLFEQAGYELDALHSDMAMPSTLEVYTQASLHTVCVLQLEIECCVRGRLSLSSSAARCQALD